LRRRRKWVGRRTELAKRRSRASGGKRRRTVIPRRSCRKELVVSKASNRRRGPETERIRDVITVLVHWAVCSCHIVTKTHSK
jgi:hypothetical protein